mgnify:CR=1 FL=1
MGYRVAVVGATGNVGREMLNVLSERDLPIDEVVAEWGEPHGIAVGLAGVFENRRGGGIGDPGPRADHKIIEVKSFAGT